MRIRFALLLLVLGLNLTAIAQDLSWDVGLGSQRSLIQARGVAANTAIAPTLLYVAGLFADDPDTQRLQQLLTSYSQLEARDKTVSLIVIANANPDADNLQFPPAGTAYRDNATANALWRWIGVHAPDLIILGADSGTGFAQALSSQAVSGIGSIPVLSLTEQNSTLEFLVTSSALAPSPAHREVLRRQQRSPAQLAADLAEIYGQDFSTPVYVPGMSVIGRMRLGQIDSVTQLLADYLNGTDLTVDNPSAMAGQLVFAEYAERTGNPAALRLVIAAADLAFDGQGNMREAVPFHSEMSDSVFMAIPLLVKAGKLSGETRYFDMAVQHLQFMERLLLREDGLYRHSPLADVAWSRGNAFPLLGLALSLSDFPQTHPGFLQLRTAYLRLLDKLVPFQDRDGLWHEVIDYPGAFAELSSTAMIGVAIKRGLDHQWISAARFQPSLNRLWHAVLVRSSMQGEFIDVCTSTGKLSSLDAYLDREAIFGRDDRAGGMVMLLANELAGNP